MRSLSIYLLALLCLNSVVYANKYIYEIQRAIHGAKEYIDEIIGPLEKAKERAGQKDHGEEITLVKGDDGHWVLVYPGESSGRQFAKLRALEPFFQVMLSLFTNPGDVVVDIGANYGTVSFTFANRVGPNGTVYAIEASPPIFKLLEMSTKLNNYEGRVKNYNYAITTTNEWLYFEVLNTDSYGSAVSTKETGYKVEGMTLDSFLQ